MCTGANRNWLAARVRDAHCYAAVVRQLKPTLNRRQRMGGAGGCKRNEKSYAPSLHILGSVHCGGFKK